MSEQQALPIGTIVRSGSHGYRIERVLGQGGFGITYMASYQDSGSGVPVYVALKEFFMKEVNGRSGTSVTTGREDGLFGSHWGHFTYSFIVVFYCVALWPLVIKLITDRKKAE